MLNESPSVRAGVSPDSRQRQTCLLIELGFSPQTRTWVLDKMFEPYDQAGMALPLRHEGRELIELGWTILLLGCRATLAQTRFFPGT